MATGLVQASSPHSTNVMPLQTTNLTYLSNGSPTYSKL
jgi:hypothetical protein